MNSSIKRILVLSLTFLFSACNTNRSKIFLDYIQPFPYHMALSFEYSFEEIKAWPASIDETIENLSASEVYNVIKDFQIVDYNGAEIKYSDSYPLRDYEFYYYDTNKIIKHIIYFKLLDNTKSLVCSISICKILDLNISPDAYIVYGDKLEINEKALDEALVLSQYYDSTISEMIETDREVPISAILEDISDFQMLYRKTCQEHLKAYQNPEEYLKKYYNLPPPPAEIYYFQFLYSSNWYRFCFRKLFNEDWKLLEYSIANLDQSQYTIHIYSWNDYIQE